MRFSMILLWALVGWCGSVPRQRIPLPLDPDPWPIYFVVRTLGVVCGIAGGWAYIQLFLPQDPIPTKSILFAATTAVGAFAAAGVVTDISARIFDRHR
jgi:hypothetical protein